MSEWCVSYVKCGGQTALHLNGSHPTLEDGVVTRGVLGTNSWYWWYSNQCGAYSSSSIRVKACPGDYYVYEFVKPVISAPQPMYCAVAFQSISSDPCYNYESLDRPWRANNESGGDYICDESFSWNGWYRFFYYGMDIRMSETCISTFTCNTNFNLWLIDPHPQIEDGVVIREICGGTYWGSCCNNKFNPIRVKACPGNYYVYELVNPQFECSGYCTDVSTISQAVSTVSPDIFTGSTINLNYDPCNNYNTLDNYWRSTLNYWSMYGYIFDHDDTRVEWDGWYRLFINGSSAQMPEWCFNYMSCGGHISLWLGDSHPRLEDGVVTREVYGSSNDQCSRYRSDPIQVKACPGNYYVYKFTRPTLSIPAPVYCAVPFSTPSVDPCYNYTSLDEPWRSTDNYYNYYGMCDYNVEWNGWYRMFNNGENAQMSESCVNQGMCGTYYPLVLNGTHPQLEDGVVTRLVCVFSWGVCCSYKSHPIRVKACPGNYYVYEFVKPMFCGAYCVETIPSIGSITPPITTTAPPVDPCYNYTILDDSWRATNNQHSSQIMCEAWVSWNGWYRLFIQGQSVQMPDTCVDEYSCGTHAPLWLNGGHPTVEDGVVTRDVCGHWSNNCCYFQSNPIKVKACPGDYYVYEFVRPTACSLAYCADSSTINTTTTVMPETTTTETTTTETTTMDNTTDVRDRCSELSCSEDEWCGKKNGVYGCLCNEDHHRPQPDSFDFSETCESSSGSISVSRCQLFEAGFPADVLHLNDPDCKGTVRNGRVEFLFDNDEHICGTNLVANGTHFIYNNFIVGTPRSEGLIISREKILHLNFSCAYPQSQTLSMNVEINPLGSMVNKTLPAGEGRYQVWMIPYEDDEFTRPFTGRVDAELDQEMHVEVRVEGVDSRQFALVMDTCWATPVNDPDYSLRWDLILSECPNPDDDTVDLLQNGVSTSSRFSFRMFIFTANSTRLYLHCAVHLCLLSSNRCSTDCGSGHQRRERRSLDFHDSASISMGPLVLSEGNTDKWVPEQVKVSEASCVCGSLMLILVPLMSVLTHF
ncbi:uncharacterized protein LOC120474776 [Pimephales promelas]|uniref:uncharacterized protein LOC120474776 n=1 Tax=Pimephales promelas TaxID=90988 RepID=UPI001955D907|nr:uncharacterized protein LOC120474776 [Pimephales promelas]